MRRPVALGVDLVAGAAFAAGAVILLGGSGLRFSFAGLAVRANNPWRWLAAAAAIAVVRFWAAARHRSDPDPEPPSAVAARLLTAAVFSTLAFRGLSALVMSCGGLDSAGYVGAADLLFRGRLTDAVPVARLLPFDGAVAAASPLGWVPAREAWHIAPRFPLGLPIVMTIFRAVLGTAGPFLVAPILGAVAAALAYIIVRRSAPHATALLAAALVAASPTFIDLAIQPMSDVPAAFWLLLAAAAAWRTRPAPILWALAGGMAMFTRPLLLLPALVIGATAHWPGGRRPLAAVAVLAALAGAFVAVQWHFYGHPFSSGYGTAGGLFSAAVVPRNVANHAKWLSYTHTPLAVIAFVLGAFRDRTLALRAALIFGAVALPYAFYVNPIDDWEMTRFLLPGWVFVLMACAPGIMWKTPASPARAGLISAGAAACVVAASLAFLTKQHVFDLWFQELKYPTVAAWVGSHTPPDAVVIASLHSGSLRHYTGRAVLRVENISPRALPDTIRALEQAGLAPFAVLEVGPELSAFMDSVQAAGPAAPRLDPQTTVRGAAILRLASHR